MSRRHRCSARRGWSIAVVMTLAAACAEVDPSATVSNGTTPGTTPGTTVAASTSSPVTTTATSSTTPTTAASSWTTATTTTVATSAPAAPTTSTAPSPVATPSVAPATTARPLEPGPYPALAAATAELAVGNIAVSVSVRRDGATPFDRTVGTRRDGRAVDADSPFVIASVGKLLTALAVARLSTARRIDVSAPVPWEAMGLVRHPDWDTVTVRDLLDHSSGMPPNRGDWLDDPAPCSVPLTTAMAAPPTDTRGRWRYSNGNYCALGLLVEHVTGQRLDAATDALVFQRAGVTGPYLARDGDRPDSAPYAKGTARLLRLGGAGEWLASTTDIADVLADVTDDDLVTMRWPGIFRDQYGWGHTGTLDGAKACAWVLEAGRTVLAAAVSGETPRTGGGVCDRLLPALAADLGMWAGEPVRVPL